MICTSSKMLPLHVLREVPASLQALHLPRIRVSFRVLGFSLFTHLPAEPYSAQIRVSPFVKGSVVKGNTGINALLPEGP